MPILGLRRGPIEQSEHYIVRRLVVSYLCVRNVLGLSYIRICVVKCLELEMYSRLISPQQPKKGDGMNSVVKLSK